MGKKSEKTDEPEILHCGQVEKKQKTKFVGFFC